MKCPVCVSDSKKHGRDRHGQQRYKCLQCRKTFFDAKPLAGKRTPLKQVSLVLRMLLEGSSIRAVERLTGVNRNTIIALMVKAGQQCQEFLAYSVYQHPVNDVEIDEQWGFVGCKEKTASSRLSLRRSRCIS